MAKEDESDETPAPPAILPPNLSRKPPLRPRVLGQSVPAPHEDATTGAAMLEADGALTVAEAQAIIDAAEALGFAQQGSGGAAAGEAYRDNGRLLIRDPAAARVLWERTGLKELFLPQGGRGAILVDGAPALGLNANLRLYRYAGGGRERFGKHVDGCDEDAEVELSSGVVGRGVTGYTVLIYLSGGGKEEAPADASATTRIVFPRASQKLLGGETRFYSSGGDGRRAGTLVAAVAPVAGRVLLHLHGYDRCLEHEAAAVVSGTKYVLRSDVVFGPPAPLAAAAAGTSGSGKGKAGGKSGSGSGRRR